MKSFKYCIWAMPAIGHQWFKLTMFPPHVSIKTNLELPDTIKFMNSIKQEKIQILLGDVLGTSHNDDFYAAFYKATCLGIVPPWWPEDAHVSFLYKYNKMISEKELRNIEKKVTKRTAILETYKIMNCTGHWIKWTEV